MSFVSSVCVYCGSSNGSNGNYAAAARRFGNQLARAGLGLVYGGGTWGVMGAVAAGCLEGGGRVTGIIPRFIMKREAAEGALDNISELIVTEDMHQRKHLMFGHSDAFVALPGGIGTLEEIVEIMTWAQLGQHEKPIVFANIDGFWNPLLALIEHMKAQGFVHSEHRLRPIIVEEVDDIVPALIDAGRVSEGDQAIIGRL